MREASLNKINIDGILMAESFMGASITLKWASGSTGPWDDTRQERVGDTIWSYKYDLPCLIKSVRTNDIKYGVYGMCEAGDLMIAIDSAHAINNLLELRVIFQKQVYKVIQNTQIPYSSLSGFIDDGGMFKLIHARLEGAQQNVGTAL